MQNTAGLALVRATQRSTRKLGVQRPSGPRSACWIASTRRSFSVRHHCLRDSLTALLGRNEEHQVVLTSQPLPSEVSQYFIEVANEGNPQDWMDVIDSFLPSPLRQTAGRKHVGTKGGTSVGVARNIRVCITQAKRRANLHVISHLGLIEGRWDTVAWIVDTVAGHEESFDPDPVPESIRTSFNQLFPQNLPLATLTLEPVVLKASETPLRRRRPYSLDYNLDFEDNARYIGTVLRKDTLGLIWRSLGSMILQATLLPPEDASKIMPHVLSAIATLHHRGVVPDSVYNFSSDQDRSALHQPPILHLLSSRIFMALSERAWNNHHAAAAITIRNKLRNSFGALSGTRYKSAVAQLRPEIWLDLVLWSCLHGGWVTDGAAILLMMLEYQGDSAWSLICWHDIVKTARSHSSDDSSFQWADLLDVMEGAAPRTRDSPHLTKASLQRTVSSELVSAYIDALVNVLNVGVGERGLPAGEVLSHISILKSFLDRQNLGLGFTTWTSTVRRLVESEGIVVEENPELTMDALNLVQPYGRELECTNALEPLSDENIYDSCALPLSLYHRVMFAHIDVGGVEGAMTTFDKLQQYTDLNQRRSIEQFFLELREQRPEELTSTPHSASVTVMPSNEQPEFFPQIPPQVLAPFLDLLTDARMADFQAWLIFSDYLDGRPIPPSLYADSGLAPALIRSATTFAQNDLLQKIINVQSDLTRDGAQSIPRPVLSAIIESQIRFRNFAHVHKMLLTITESEETRLWFPSIISALAREILFMQKDVASEQESDGKKLAQAMSIFKNIFSERYGCSIQEQGKYRAEDVAHCIVGILSSINSDWAIFCNGLTQKRGNWPFELPKKGFNAILEGVVQLYGVPGGRRLMDTWCQDMRQALPLFREGVAKIPNSFISRGDKYFDPQYRVLLLDVPGEPWGFYGRLRFDFSTLKIILRRLLRDGEGSVKSDVDESVINDNAAPEYDRQEMVDWALETFKAMGLMESEAEREILRLRSALRFQEPTDAVFAPHEEIYDLEAQLHRKEPSTSATSTLVAPRAVGHLQAREQPNTTSQSTETSSLFIHPLTAPSSTPHRST